MSISSSTDWPMDRPTNWWMDRYLNISIDFNLSIIDLYWPYLIKKRTKKNTFWQIKMTQKWQFWVILGLIWAALPVIRKIHSNKFREVIKFIILVLYWLCHAMANISSTLVYWKLIFSCYKKNCATLSQYSREVLIIAWYNQYRTHTHIHRCCPWWV